MAELGLTVGRQRTLAVDFSSGVWSSATQRFLDDLLKQQAAHGEALVLVQQVLITQPIEASLAPVGFPVAFPGSAAEVAPVQEPFVPGGDTAALAVSELGPGLGVAPWQ